jgi:hypothetical protein
MRHVAYFLIEPRPIAIQELSARAGRRLSEWMLEPYLATRCFADRSAWRQFEVALAVKLTHVAQLREYDQLRTDQAAQAILGSDRVSAALFDRWWTIRQLSYRGPSENKQDLLNLFLDKIDLTGNALIDYWVRARYRSIES